MHNLSVIIPFYNENKFLLDSVNRVLDTGVAYQIILSDDFSNDGSEKIAKKLSEDYQSTHLVNELKLFQKDIRDYQRVSTVFDNLWGFLVFLTG